MKNIIDGENGGGERNGTYTEANSLEVTQCIEFTIFTGRVSTSKQNS